MTISALFLQVSPPDISGELRLRIEAAPQPVASFIERRAGCNHFFGEEAYDPQRAKELRAALSKLRCDSLVRDESTLRRSYRDQPAVLQLLADTQALLGW